MTVEALAAEPRSNAEIFSDIEASYGSVTPEAVLTEAAHVSHEWHHRFEWNDTEAAHRHRLDQARTVIRSVRLEITYKTITIKPPEFVRDPTLDGDEQGYARLLTMKRAKNQRAELMKQEMRRAVGNLHRALHIALAVGEMETAEKISAALEALDAE